VKRWDGLPEAFTGEAGELLSEIWTGDLLESVVRVRALAEICEAMNTVSLMKLSFALESHRPAIDHVLENLAPVRQLSDAMKGEG